MLNARLGEERWKMPLYYQGTRALFLEGKTKERREEEPKKRVALHFVCGHCFKPHFVLFSSVQALLNVIGNKIRAIIIKSLVSRASILAASVPPPTIQQEGA